MTNEQNSIQESSNKNGKLTEGSSGQFDTLVRRQRPSMFGALMALTAMCPPMPTMDLCDDSPNIKTYGSNYVKRIPYTEVKNMPKEQGRNELCKCGSGKKYKKCCWALSA